MSSQGINEVRLDKWLWAARFFKTRSLAKQAVDTGHVFYNNSRCKASRSVSLGAQLRIRKPEQTLVVLVLALSEQRGPAAQAQLLYQETEESRIERLKEQELQRLDRQAFQAPAHKPNKHQRRQLTAIKHEPFA